MRVVLSSMPVRLQQPNLLPQVGLLSLASYLESLGHEVHLVDAAKSREPQPDLARRIAELEPDLVGVGGIVTAYRYALSYTREIKRLLPDVPIVLGGTILIQNVENCFTRMPIDFAIHGYGEIALGKLAEHLEGKRPVDRIPGLSYRDGGEVVTTPGREFFRHMDDKPIPAYHLVDMGHYSRTIVQAVPIRRPDIPAAVKKDPRGMIVMGTLGCTDRCTFCVHEQEFVGLKRHGNRYLLDHLKLLHEEYGINYFVMGEEMFLSGLETAKEFSALMREQLPDCVWGASTRADRVSPELIAELTRGTCVGLHWGVESGSQRMLDLMLKRMTVEVNERAYRLCSDAGLIGSLSFMVGNVGETPVTVKETIESIRRTGIDEGTVFHTSAYPGGRVWDWAIERGIVTDTHEYLMKVSDVDPEGTVNVNLTPYPEWVLKAWKRMVARALFEQMLVRRPDVRAQLRSGFLPRLRAWAGERLVPLAVDLYTALHDLRRKLIPTARDRRFEFRTDRTGALLPDRLFVAKPQSFLDEAETLRVLEQPAARIAYSAGPPVAASLPRAVQTESVPEEVAT